MPLKPKKTEGDGAEKPAKKAGLLSKRPKVSTTKTAKTPTKDKDAATAEPAKEPKKGLLSRAAKETPKVTGRSQSATDKTTTPKKAAAKSGTTKKETAPKLGKTSAPTVEKSAHSTSALGAKKKTAAKSKVSESPGTSPLTPTARAKSETSKGKERPSLSDTPSAKGTKTKDVKRGVTPPVPKVTTAKKATAKTASAAAKGDAKEAKTPKKGAAGLVQKLAGLGKSKTAASPKTKEKRKPSESVSLRTESESKSSARSRLATQSPAPVPKPRRASTSSTPSRPTSRVTGSEAKKKRKSTKDETPSVRSTTSPAPEVVRDRSESVEPTKETAMEPEVEVAADPVDTEMEVPQEDKMEVDTPAEVTTAEEVVMISPRSAHDPVQPNKDEEESLDMAPPTTLSTRSHSAASRTSLEEPLANASDTAEPADDSKVEALEDVTPVVEEQAAEMIKVEPIPEDAPVQMDIESSLPAESVLDTLTSYKGESLDGTAQDRDHSSAENVELSLAADTESLSKMSLDTEILTSVQRGSMASERAESIDQASQRIDDAASDGHGSRVSYPDDDFDQASMELAITDDGLSLPSEADAAYDTGSAAMEGAPSEDRDSLNSDMDDGQDQMSMELGGSPSEDRMSVDIESVGALADFEPEEDEERNMEIHGGQTRGGTSHEKNRVDPLAFQMNHPPESENSATGGRITTSARTDSSHAGSAAVAADTRSIRLMSEVAEEPEDDDDAARLADLDAFSEARSEAIPEDKTDLTDDLTVPDVEGYRGETFSSSSWSSDDVFASGGEDRDLDLTPDASQFGDGPPEEVAAEVTTPPEVAPTESQKPNPEVELASPEPVLAGHLSAPEELQSRDTPVWNPLPQRKTSRKGSTEKGKEAVAEPEAEPVPTQAPPKVQTREWNPLPVRKRAEVPTPEPREEKIAPTTIPEPVEMHSPEPEPVKEEALVFIQEDVEVYSPEPQRVERTATPPSVAVDPVVIATPELVEKKKARASMSEAPSKAPAWDPLPRRKSSSWDPLHQRRTQTSEPPTPTFKHTPTVIKATERRAPSLESAKQTRIPLTKPKSKAKKVMDHDLIQQHASSGDDPSDENPDPENIEPPHLANPPKHEEMDHNRNKKGRRGNLIVSCLYVIGGLAVTVLFFRRRG